MTPNRTAQFTFDGTGGEVLSLALKTGFLTFLTLGIYRFWAKTRLRTYFWSRSRLDGMGFEYTGTGLEMFLGFLVAMVVLAVYLALVQLAFFMFGMRFILNPRTPAEALGQVLLIYASFFALIPLMLFAQYRSMRYKMVRTRFRGIRFGMTSAAWGYTWRAILYFLATICTLGLLHPLMRFRLEQFMADRISYGDARLVQGGKWTELYGAMKHIFIGFVIVIVGGAVGLSMGPAGGLLGLPGYVWVLIGFVSYQVQGFAVLTRGKRLELIGGGTVTFASAPRTATVIGYYIVGSIAVGAAAFLLLALAGITGVNMQETTRDWPPEIKIGIGLLAYVAFLITIGAVYLATTTRLVIGHFISTTSVLNADALGLVRQRAGEAGADAEGFADALDIGGAF